MPGELYHWGILGMKWGIRRYQNPDGSLTELGRLRYQKQQQKKERQEFEKQKAAEIKAVRARKRIRMDKLTTEELKTINERMRMEKEYYQTVKDIRSLNDTLKEMNKTPIRKTFERGKEATSKAITEANAKLLARTFEYMLGGSINALFDTDVIDTRTESDKKAEKLADEARKDEQKKAYDKEKQAQQKEFEKWKQEQQKETEKILNSIRQEYADKEREADTKHKKEILDLEDSYRHERDDEKKKSRYYDYDGDYY